MGTFVLSETAWAVAGIFAWLSFVITCHQIYKHLFHWSRPEFQKWICRILFMVPIYALGSWLSLRFYTWAVYFDTVRNMYEAFVIYSFLSLCFAYLGGESAMVHALSGQYHKPSCLTMTCCLKPFPYSIFFLRLCKQATLQFCVVKPVTSIITIILEAKGLYSEGDLAPNRGYLYIAIVYNISIFFALTALMVFYAATKDLLKPHKPILKFLVVKSVIFLAFWQGVALAVAEAAGVLYNGSEAKPGQVAAAYQSFMICIEMFFVSLLHLKAFSWAPFAVDSTRSIDRALIFARVSSSLKSTLNPKDIVDDTIRNFSTKYNEYHQTEFDDSDYAHHVNSDAEGAASRDDDEQHVGGACGSSNGLRHRHDNRSSSCGGGGTGDGELLGDITTNARPTSPAGPQSQHKEQRHEQQHGAHGSSGEAASSSTSRSPAPKAQVFAPRDDGRTAVVTGKVGAADASVALIDQERRAGAVVHSNSRETSTRRVGWLRSPLRGVGRSRSKDGEDENLALIEHDAAQDYSLHPTKSLGLNSHDDDDDGGGGGSGDDYADGDGNNGADSGRDDSGDCRNGGVFLRSHPR